MADTYNQVYIQVVFAVKYRKHLIDEAWETDLYKYISGIIKQKDCKPLAINGMPDHIHILINQSTDIKISELVREVKAFSTRFIKRYHCSCFQWQNGYGAFSYSKSHLDRVIKYIHNQKNHHAKKSFKQEYLALLEKFEIPYEEKYLFDFHDE